MLKLALLLLSLAVLLNVYVFFFVHLLSISADNLEGALVEVIPFEKKKTS